MDIIVFILATISLLSFFIFALDKLFAKMNTWRVPEVVLLSISFLGGAAGALAAMNMFRHKTNKKWFTKAIPIAMLSHLLIIIVLFFNPDYLQV